MGFTLRRAGDTQNPRAARPFGEQATAGQLTYWKNENGKTYFIVLLGEGEHLFKNETNLGGFRSEGFFDSIVWYRYRGFMLTPYDAASGTGDFIFHKGYETNVTLGYADPLQGRPTFFPELDWTFSGRPYCEVRLPTNLSDPETEPVDSEIRLKTSCLWDYDSSGARVGSVPTFTSNPARVLAFSARLAGIDIATRFDWPSWVAFRNSCDFGIGWTTGGGNGLTGEYFNNVTLSGASTTRIDPVVQFNYGRTTDNISRRWTGYIDIPETGTYTFYTLSDDGVRLWVNDTQIINDWTNHGVLENTASIALTAGKRSITLEFFQGWLGAQGAANPGEVTLSWSSSKIAKQVIPQQSLFSDFAATTNRVIPRFEADIVFPGVAWPMAFQAIMTRAIGWKWQFVNGKIKFIWANTRTPSHTFIYETGIPFAVDPANNTFEVQSHGLTNGDILRLTSLGTLPGGLFPATNYYVRDAQLGPNAFKVTLTPNGDPVNITDTGTDTPVYTMRSNIVRDSVIAQRKDPLQKPNYLVVGYRNKDDNQFTQGHVEVIRQEIIDLLNGKLNEPGVIQLGVARQSEAERIGEALMRKACDRDIEIQLKGQKKSHKVALHELVYLIHPRGDWRLTPFTGHVGPLLCEVVQEQFESSITTANEKSFILKIWQQEYDDTAHGPIVQRAPGNVASAFDMPPRVTSVTLAQRVLTRPDNLTELGIDGLVVFNTTNYDFDQRARVWWRKPEDEKYFSVDAATDTFTVVGHGYAWGSGVMVRSETTLPGGLSDAITYFVINNAADTFKLSAYPGGPAVDLTDTGTGSHFVAPFVLTDKFLTPTSGQAAFTLQPVAAGTHHVKVVSESTFQQKLPFEQHITYTATVTAQALGEGVVPIGSAGPADPGTIIGMDGQPIGGLGGPPIGTMTGPVPANGYIPLYPPVFGEGGAYQQRSLTFDNLLPLRPKWDQVDLATGVRGVLPASQGGGYAGPFTDGQLMIGRTSDSSLVKANLTGSENQVNVLNGPGSIALSLPQNIHTAANPRFNDITISGEAKLASIAWGSATGGGGQRRYHINEFSDVLWQADKRFTVINGWPQWFDGSYGTVAPNATAAINKVAAITNKVGVTESAAGVVTKTAVGGWGNAGYFSVESIVGDGYIEWTATETTTSRSVGLSTSDVNQNYTSILYSFQMSTTSVYIYESGVYQGSFGTVTANTTVFKIARVGTTLTYYKNGVSQRVVTGVTTAPLYADTSMNTEGGTLGPITIVAVGTPSLPLNATSVISINFAGQSGVPLAGITYPAGLVVVSFWADFNKFVSISLRYNRNGVWTTSTPATNTSTTPSYFKTMEFKILADGNYLTDLELTIVTGSNPVWITAINYSLEAVTPEVETPTFSKATSTNTLHGSLLMNTRSMGPGYGTALSLASVAGGNAIYLWPSTIFGVHAGIEIDKWEVGQDAFYGGTKDFFVRDNSINAVRLHISPLGLIQMGHGQDKADVAIWGGLHIGNNYPAAGDGNLLIDGNVGHPGYVSQLNNWQITAGGSADFRYLFANELHVKSFIADLEQALAGGQIITKSVGVLAEDFIVPSPSRNASLIMNDLPGAPGMQIFQAGDYVGLRRFNRDNGSLIVSDCWGTVSSYVDRADGKQMWTFKRSSVIDAGAMEKDSIVFAKSIVLDYGVSGNGFYEVSAVDGYYGENAPYAQVITWTGSPIYANRVVRARLGNLKGITGQANEFGLIAGTYSVTTGQYFRASNQAFELHGINLSMWDGAANVIKLDRTAPSFALGNPMPTSYSAGTGVWMGKDGLDYKFRVGTPGGAGIFWDNSTLSVAGIITATSGLIGGWTIASAKLSSTGINLHSGSNAGLAFGSTPPTSATVGTGIWLDLTGMHGLAGNQLQAKFDAVTGKITAGAGNVNIGFDGIRLNAVDVGGNYLKWLNGSSTIGDLVAFGGGAADSYFNIVGYALNADTTKFVQVYLEANHLAVGASCIMTLTAYGSAHATKANKHACSFDVKTALLWVTEGHWAFPASTVLELRSTTGAFVPTRMTTTERDALTAIDSMVLWNTTTSKLQVRAGGAWVDLH